MLFNEVCVRMEILLDDGLKLFTKNIYINSTTTYDIPFIGHGLHKQPFNLRACSRVPDSITISEEAAQEMCRRFKLLASHVRAKLKKRYQEVTVGVNVAKRLAAYVGFTDEFKGSITSITVTETLDKVRLTLKDVGFSAENVSFAEFLKIQIPVKAARELSLQVGDELLFTGKIFSYIKCDSRIGIRQKHYGIAPHTITVTRSASWSVKKLQKV